MKEHVIFTSLKTNVVKKVLLDLKLFVFRSETNFSKSMTAECPLTFLTWKFYPGQKGGKEERKNGEEKQENLKGKRLKIENGRRKGMKMSR